MIKIAALFRSLIMVLLYPFVTLFFSLVVMIGMLFKNRDLAARGAQGWAGTSLKMFGIRVTEKGRENIPQGSCLFVFNHTSFFDVFVMAYTLKGIRFGAKIELFKIPLFGKAMALYGVLPIARGNREKVFQVYEKAKERTLHGEQFALSPEGGRNTEEKLLPFKSGPFVFAINSGIPVVPVVIKNASKILPKGGILPNKSKWHEDIYIEYLPPTPTENYTFESRGDLASKIYHQMNAHF